MRSRNRQPTTFTFDKAWLADEGDVDRYLNALREALLAEVQQGRKVQI